jgi:flagellar biosynthetic protein FliO
VKVRPHPFVLLAIVLVLACSFAAAPTALAAGSGSDAQQQGQEEASGDDDSGSTAAQRREARSDFEREKLDPEAFGEESSKESGGDSESGGSMLRFVFGLVVVLAVIYGVHWLLKRWGQSRMQGVAGTAGIIDVVATTPLAQGRSLHLVRVGKDLVLVGATEQSITRIGEMDAAALGAQAADYGKGEFQAMLNGAMVAGQPGVPAGMGGTSSTQDPFMKRFLDNLRLTTAR